MMERPASSASGAYSRLVSPAPQSPWDMNRFHSPSARAFSFSSRITGGSACGSSASASCRSYTASLGKTCCSMNDRMRSWSSRARGARIRSPRLLLICGSGEPVSRGCRAPCGSSRRWWAAAAPGPGRGCLPSRCRRRLWPMIAAIFIRPRARNQSIAGSGGAAVAGRRRAVRPRWAGRAPARPSAGKLRWSAKSRNQPRSMRGSPTLQISQSTTATARSPRTARCPSRKSPCTSTGGRPSGTRVGEAAQQLLGPGPQFGRHGVHRAAPPLQLAGGVARFGRVEPRRVPVSRSCSRRSTAAISQHAGPGRRRRAARARRAPARRPRRRRSPWRTRRAALSSTATTPGTGTGDPASAPQHPGLAQHVVAPDGPLRRAAPP